MRKATIAAAILLPQVAVFYAVRSVVRAVTDKREDLLDGLELAVLDELASWDRFLYAEPADDGWGPRVLP